MSQDERYHRELVVAAYKALCSASYVPEMSHLRELSDEDLRAIIAEHYQAPGPIETR
jgi:hypothetical protein